MLATFFGIGEGTVEAYTNRCLMAILTLQAQENLLGWPTPESRQELQTEFEDFGFE
jgi:hypothetical protein